VLRSPPPHLSLVPLDSFSKRKSQEKGKEREQKFFFFLKLTSTTTNHLPIQYNTKQRREERG